MSDRYNVDDILKELDTRHSNDDSEEEIPKDEAHRESVTEIIDSEAVNKALRAGKQHPKPDLSVTQVINSLDKKGGQTARQMTEEETSARRERDIEKAIKGVKKPKERRDTLSARQLTEEESSERIGRDVARAADIKKYERLRGEHSEDEVVYPESEYVKPFVKPQVSEDEDDDDIIFHTRGDLVTTETMEIRKQKKIDDINRALLKIDSEAESPDDMLNSLNPMESREKAQEIIKDQADDSTDTLAVAGNDLKRIGRGEERLKEYHPSNGQDEYGEPLAGVQSPVFPAEIHVGETIVEALNKKIIEQEKSDGEPEFSENDEAAEEAPAEENEELERIRMADELAQKKKRRIANFILDTPDTEELETPVSEDISEDDDYEDDYDEPVDLDDENVIRDRLTRASKGLLSRLLILAALFCATLFVELTNVFDWNLGGLNKIINFHRSAGSNYLYTQLTIGILSFAACSSVISNGFARLLKLRPDGDTLCAFAHIGALGAMIPYLINNEYILRSRAHVYLLVSLAALIFNTLSKICTVKTAQNNFAFTFGNHPKYFIGRCEDSNAEMLAKGAGTGIPAVGAMRKTEMLCDFIVSTYCEDASDRLSRKLVPAVGAAAVAGGIAGFFACAGETDMLSNRFSFAFTVLTAILALGAAFSSSMTVTLPLLTTSLGNKKRGSAILGYNAATELSELSAVLLEANSLFPANSIRITNICGYDKPKNRGEGKINIDEAIIYAASLAVASDSILADAFFGMLNYKRELLKDVSGCVYENCRGVMGWIDRKRVMLGNRSHMKAHEITVPNMKKESAANANNDEVIYLAVGGEVCLLFFVRLSADPAVQQSVKALSDSGVSMVIRTVDGMITDSAAAVLFGIDPDDVRILPFEAHETFSENTRFISSGSAGANCTGTFPSFAGAIIEAKKIRSKTYISSIVQLCGIALGTLLALIFALFFNFRFFGAFYLLIYNLVFGAAALAVQFIKR